MFKARKTNIERLNQKYRTIKYMSQKDFGALNDNLIFLTDDINTKRYSKTTQPIAGTVIESGFMDWKWNYFSHSAFKNSTTLFPYSKINKYVKKGKLLKDNQKMKMFFRLSNTKSFVCFAGAGSGKTTQIVQPTILANALSPTKPNLFITDPKGDLVKSTFNILKQQGYNVRVLNILDEENTDCFSPFTLIKEMLFNLTLKTEEHWNNLGTKLKELKSQILQNENTNFQELEQQIINIEKLQNTCHDELNKINVELSDIIYSLDENPRSTKSDIWDKAALTSIYLIAWLIIDDLIHQFFEWRKNNKDATIENQKKEFLKLFVKFSFQSIYWTLAQFGEDGTTKYIQFYKDKFNIDIYNASPIEIFNHPGILKWQQVFRENLNQNKSTFTKDVITNSLKELERFNSPLLKNLTVFNTFNLEDLYGDKEQPFALFVTINNSQEATIPYVRWFINYVLMKVNFYASQGARTKLTKPLMCIFEEIGNIGFIKNLPNIVNEGRGKNIFVSLFFQTYTQYQEKYHGSSGGFIDSCEYKLLLSNSESANFAKELALYSGVYYKFNKEQNKHFEYQRVTPNDIYSLPPFKSMVFMKTINVSYIAGLIPWYLLGYPSLDQLKIQIDDPNYNPSSLIYRYNPLFKTNEDNTLVTSIKSYKNENISKTNNQDIQEEENINIANEILNTSSKPTKHSKTNSISIDTSKFKEEALNVREKFLCEILNIKYGSPDIQIIKDILAEKEQKIIYTNNNLNINQIFNTLFIKHHSSIKKEDLDILNLNNQIQQKEPEYLKYYERLKEYSFLKDLINHSPLNPIGYKKFINIKNLLILIQKINGKQIVSFEEVNFKLDKKTFDVLNQIKDKANFNKSTFKTLKNTLETNVELAKEFKNWFKITM